MPGAATETELGARPNAPVPRHRRLARLVVLVGILLIVLILAGAAVRGRGRVARNVTLAGAPIGGMSRPELATHVRGLAARYARATVVVRTKGGTLELTAAEIGLAVDRTKTVSSALAVGHGGNPVARLWVWARSLLGSRRAPVRVTFDRAALHQLVATRDPGVHTAAVEPSLATHNNRVVAVDGKPGKGLNPRAVISALPRAATRGLPIVMQGPRGSVPPRFQLADAQKLVAKAEALTSKPLPVSAGSTTIDVPTSILRSWIRALPGPDELGLGMDEAGAGTDLNRLLGGAGTDPVDAGFTVSGGVVQVTPGHAGTACCTAEAPARVAAALASRPTNGVPVELPLKEVQPRRTVDEARKLGVQEQVSTFSTHHNPGEPRVQNIHKVADIIRGTVLEPGQSVSVNGKLGPRTAAKGYLEAPVIGEGSRFSTDIGGGISQFATTMFNAAFFAGMDVTEYSAHGLYISRYPYGREATLSFPHPDLIVKNNSPYGVLIWTSYTATDITVSFYSTHWVDAEQTNQTKVEKPAIAPADRDPAKPPIGPCVAVTTERTRRYVSDGRTTTDKFYAYYRPEEGASCPPR
jgi:vancomycin resistance protein YoaR